MPASPDEPRSDRAAGRRWRIGVDVGGTFADAVATRDDGTCRRVKLLTNGVLRAPCRAAVGGLELPGAPGWWGPALVGARVRTAHGDADAVRKALDSTYVRMTVCFMQQELQSRLDIDERRGAELGALLDEVQVLLGKVR